MELMTEFYRRHWRLKEDVSTALWKAKMSLHNKTAVTGRRKYKVADWAGFIPSGVPLKR